MTLSEAGTTDDTPDLVVLGGGSGGYAAALRAAQLGLRVVLVERDLLGGTCLHRGCIPTKALLHAAEIADAARHGAAFGVHTTLDRIDPDQVRTYARQVVSRLHQGLTGLIDARGITVVRGEGRLVRDADGVGVAVTGDDGTEQTHRAASVVLATGSAPRTLPGIEVDHDRVITSDDAVDTVRLPQRVIVLGGGVIGCEFASVWRSFGAEVTIVEALDRLVAAEEPTISRALLRAFGKRGITVLTGSPVTGVTRDADLVRVEVGGRTLEADLLLVAVGRGPVSDGLGYAEAGVETDRGFVVTDDRLATSVPGVYAVGDLVGGLQLAHRGFAHGLFVAEDLAHRAGLLDRAPAVVDDVDIPRVTYCEPQVASVGLTEQQAEERWGADRVTALTYDLAGNGRAQILRTQGFVKLVRRIDGPVVGVHLIGSGVDELIGEAQLITNWQAEPSDVAPLIHAHPTRNEALGEAHLALAGSPLHSHH